MDETSLVSSQYSDGGIPDHSIVIYSEDSRPVGSAQVLEEDRDEEFDVPRLALSPARSPQAKRTASDAGYDHQPGMSKRSRLERTLADNTNTARINVDTRSKSQASDTATGGSGSGHERSQRKVASLGVSSPTTTPEQDEEDNSPADNPPRWTGATTDEPIFLDGGLGPLIQRHFAACPWGVQYMIAFYLMNGALKRENITISNLKMLRGTNEEMAPKVLEVLLGEVVQDGFSTSYEKERAARCPWAELDREHAALSEDPNALLGGKGRSGQPYGGRIVFPIRARTRDNSNPGNAKLELERPELSSSDGFRREYGSSAFIRMRCDDKLAHHKELGSLLCRPFVLGGRVFRAFRRKDGNVFFVEVDEVLPGYDPPPPRYGANCRPKSFFGFVDWHNPRLLNSHQNAAKYSARFDLKLSNSVPACIVEQMDIFFDLDDIVSPAANGSNDAKFVMTDGCGYANRAIFSAVKATLSLDRCPTVIQMRIAGSKGLLFLHPGPEADACERPQVWLRPSQVKIKYGVEQLASPSKRTLDVLRTDHLRTPSRASTEVLINLSHNGVPTAAITAYIRKTIQELTDSLTDFDSPHAMQSLWHKIAKARAVMMQRQARMAVGEARALYGYDYVEEDDGDDGEGEEFDALRERSIAWWPDEISGSPSTLEETVLALLDAGFKPTECGVLASKLEKVINSIVMNYIKPPRFKIDIPMSCTGFITPDPTGTLEPGEIFLRSTSDNLMGILGTKTDSITGDVLITRNPCKLPTDVRKVKAVYSRALHDYTNQIIISVKGDRSLASILAGGDYDGDKCFVTWDPAVVEPFQNADLKFADPPPDFDKRFLKNPKSVRRMPRASIRQWQQYLLALLSDKGLVGIYSKRHSLSIYLKGLDDPLTILISHMFAYILDGDKNGMRVDPDVLIQHAKEFAGLGVPKWSVPPPKHSGLPSHIAPENEQQLIRWEVRETVYRQHKPFIMDEVARAAKQAGVVFREELTRRISSYCGLRDDDLLRPFEDALGRAEAKAKLGSTALMSALGKIQAHARDVAKEHGEEIDEKFTAKPIIERQDILRGLSKMFHTELELTPVEALEFGIGELSRIAASYMYKYDSDHRQLKAGRQLARKGQKPPLPWSRLPWDVAFRDLCHIKASALGMKPVTQEFYDRMEVRRQR